jgi:hypothetical protein
LLQLLVVLSGVYMWSINPFTNPYLVYSHKQTRDNWCQKWLDCPLYWILIVIWPYQGNGTKDGTNDGTPAGHNKSRPRGDGRNEGLVKRN